MDRETKLRKLEQFRRRLPYASESALAATIADIRSHGLPELHHRRDLYDAKMQEIRSPTPYGSLILELDLVGEKGAAVKTQNINPLAMLYRSFYGGGLLKDLIMREHAVRPSSVDQPWKLALYIDEIVPGNPLATENLRKCWVIYISFLELGGLALQREQAWLCAGVQRTSLVNKLEGGVSQMVAAVVKLFFTTLGFDSRAGLRLKSASGDVVMLHLDMGCFLMDGGAHKYLWNVKGDSGMRFCTLCLNIVAKTSRIARDGLTDDTSLVIDDTAFDDLVFATDRDVKDTQQRLKDEKQRLTKARFALLEKATGFNFNKHCILQDDELVDIVKPIAQYLHDPMHCLCVSGVFNTCLYLLLLALTAVLPDIYDKISEYADSWISPGWLRGVSVAKLFSGKRAANHKASESFKCTASEALTVYQVIAVFLSRVVKPAGVCTHECNAFLALAELMDMVLVTSLGKITPLSLHQSVQTFLGHCKLAGWQEMMHPKFHWLVHLPTHLAKFGFLPTCWVHERKHKLVKRYMGSVFNTAAYEASVLTEVACHELSELAAMGGLADKTTLVNPKPADAKLLRFLQNFYSMQVDPKTCFTSVVVNLLPVGKCYINDFIVLKKHTHEIEAAKVKLHVMIGEVCYSIVSLMKLSSVNKAVGSSEWLDVESDVMIKSCDIDCSCMYSQNGKSFTAILPLKCRC